MYQVISYYPQHIFSNIVSIPTKVTFEACTSIGKERAMTEKNEYTHNIHIIIIYF